jgi:hypothetical protein
MDLIRSRTVHEVSKKWHGFCVTLPEYCSRLYFYVDRDHQYPWKEVQNWVQKRARLIRDLDFKNGCGMRNPLPPHDSPEVMASFGLFDLSQALSEKRVLQMSSVFATKSCMLGYSYFTDLMYLVPFH